MHTKTGVLRLQLDMANDMASATNKTLSVPETVDVCVVDWLRNQRPDVDKIMTCTPADSSRPIETVALKRVQSQKTLCLSYVTMGGRENVGLQKVIRAGRIGPCE